MTVVPEDRDSLDLTEMPPPRPAVGICGTDVEIINGEYGAED
jgi:threonine dehydrogenase-like Zn-dependent dehydrogenase